MGSKKRRQRGSRTHSGGSHKNRRGAGHRGGRGRAGRDKHEFHNYEPLGKHGFSRPDSITDTVEEIRIQKIDEDVALYAADGDAETDGDAYVIDARDVVDTGHDVDVVKVLGGGQVRNELVVTADAFTAGAVAGIEEAGGDAVLSDRAEEAEAEDVNEDSSDES
ncbi:large subunit ribosomal protein L15 [Halohasta litchfieldiae]|jgi:large subunit ribosomal protein L15|uniref:Large ribosomal subunit protein uL15 n=1 Tax=Halohasta litchfieldiae TaxID=1073996 RepID=A0A1H6X493_9EURY|nr:uL15m family ribosomal protein [Halohasta litchfieldiae]ATW90067.1 large subunit ribosomal protein L15 [Halohasta litchfieldiae]SEJ21387.1 LSU ribosomal protein L15P [Halohasta litchfieldiae]